MPRPLSLGSWSADVDVRHPSILHPAPPRVLAFDWTSSSAGLRSATDHRETHITAASRGPIGLVSGQVQPGHIAGYVLYSGWYAGHVPAAGEGPAGCSPHAIEEVSDLSLPGYHSRLFLVLKHDRTFHRIIDLKKLNLSKWKLCSLS